MKWIEHIICIIMLTIVYIAGARTGTTLWLWLTSWYEQIVYHRYF